MRLVGRRSRSILDSPRVLGAPRAPYRPAAGAPYAKGTLDIVELPMAVTPIARLPVIGTSLRDGAGVAAAPPRDDGAARASSQPRAARHRFSPTPRPTRSRRARSRAQPDLRRPLAHKLAALEETLVAARAAGARFARLDDVAAGVS